MPATAPPIAIVGMDCRYPGAASPGALWDMALARRQAFRRIPEQRFRLADYAPRGEADPDGIYDIEAAVLEDYAFDRQRFRIPTDTFRTTDLTHWLALDVATGALADAGFENGEGLPNERTAVVVGNTLTGEFSRAGILRLRWPYVRRVLAQTLTEEGLNAAQLGAVLQRFETQFKAPFPVPNEDSLAGGLANTIAGRICNHYDLKGGGYTVDGACASSLLSVISACNHLAHSEADVVVAGAVDLSLDPFELVGFARNGALSRRGMRIYDRDSDGFWPGEGCGFMVLMRAADARVQGRSIHALIQGWGMASDGQGGLTRPTQGGQVLAIERAFAMTGFQAGSAAYFEGHGTGTAVGDPIEIAALGHAIGDATATGPIALGSIKANIGHTKAAAGLAGLIKTVMATKAGVVPPCTGCETPHAAFVDGGDRLYPALDAHVWRGDAPFRAGVNAMGFGGINTHVVVSAAEDLPAARALTSREQNLLRTPQDAEVFFFAATTADALRQSVERVAVRAPGLSRAELTDCAAALVEGISPAPWRATIVAARPDELHARAKELLNWISAGHTSRLDFDRGLALGRADLAPRITFLFSGQGGLEQDLGGIWRQRFPATVWPSRETMTAACAGDTAAAQPIIVEASLAALSVLDELGLRAAAGLGHSLGELTALHWGGALDADSLRALVRQRGQVMAELGAADGAMAAIALAPDAAAALIENYERVRVACHNGPGMCVVAGHVTDVTAIVRRVQAAGHTATRLPVSQAFHSPLMTHAQAAFSEVLDATSMMVLEREVVSTVTGKVVAKDADLRDLLRAQITAPVLFVEALRDMAGRTDLFIEVGAGEMLTRLACEITDVPVATLDVGGGSLVGLLSAVGAAYALGAPVRVQALFAGRFTRPFSLDREPEFLTNPCESAPRGDALPNDRTVLQSGIVSPPPRVSRRPSTSAGVSATTIDMVRRTVADRTGLAETDMHDDLRLLSDLHLNSIAVAQLVTDICQYLDMRPPRAPTEYADASLGELAQALGEVRALAPEDDMDEPFPAGCGPWVRPFVTVYEECKRSRTERSAVGAWRFYGDAGESLEIAWGEDVGPSEDAPAGVVVYLNEQGETHGQVLLHAAQDALCTPTVTRFVVVQHGSGGAAFARTLSLEMPELAVCVVDVPPGCPQAFNWAEAEAVHATAGYNEVHFDRDGVRRVPVMRPLDNFGASSEGWGLDPSDVVLVSGGGKGIGAECALALAQDTKARIAVLGRSPATDEALRENLKRFRAYGVEVMYCQADVTDPAQVDQTVVEIENNLGPVTAVLHAAGINQPVRLENLDESTLAACLAVKEDGARNILKAVDGKRLRLLVAFGSIIARTGLPGEAHYGHANERLSRVVDDFAAAHSACRCRTFEWSVWAGAGMGENLSVLENLSRQGITPLSIEQGVAAFLDLIARDIDATAVVVAGRFGAPPTVDLGQSALPLTRFLETPKVFYPGIELVCEADVSRATDPYLGDHKLNGQPVFPAVMALEAMVQVATVLAEGSGSLVIESVRMPRPILVPDGGVRRLRVAALKADDGWIDVVLRSDESGFLTDHFSARVQFGAVPELERVVVNGAVEALPPELDPTVFLYDHILFHRGRFRRVAAYRVLDATTCSAEIAPASKEAWFGAFLSQQLTLSDPGARDALMHALQACIPHERVLPAGVERMVIGYIDPCKRHVVYGRERTRGAGRYVYDVDVVNEDGCVVESWRGLDLRSVGERPWRSPFPSSLLAPYVGRCLMERFSPHAVHVNMVRGDEDGRAVRRAATANAAAGEKVMLLRRPDGRPEYVPGADAPAGLSLTHSGQLTLAVSAPFVVGCDLEAMPGPDDRGATLNGEKADLARFIAKDVGETARVSKTRVWAALESLRKCGWRSEGVPLVLHASESDGWVELASGSWRVMTYHSAATVEEGDGLILAIATVGPDASFANQATDITLFSTPASDVQLVPKQG